MNAYLHENRPEPPSFGTDFIHTIAMGPSPDVLANTKIAGKWGVTPPHI